MDLTPLDMPAAPELGDNPVAEGVVAALRRISRAMDVHSRSMMRQWGLTGPQLTILRELSRKGEMSTGQIATAVSLSQATVTGILDRLERRGLVDRRRSQQDKRKVMVKSTDACTRLLHTAPPMLQQSLASQLEQLADWEQTLILTGLQRLVVLMENRPREEAPSCTNSAAPVTSAPDTTPAARCTA